MHRIFLALILGGSFCQVHAGTQKAVMPDRHFALFEKYCLDCHDADTQKGKLNLDDLSFEISRDIPTAEHWDNILAALNSKEMPPEDKKQIPNDEKAAFLEALSDQMVLARNILGDSGGEITMRRLNRREYQNTIETLLGFRPDVSDLPDDDGTGGFDTSGASLFFSSDQFEQYRAIATQALSYVLNERRRPEPRTIRYEGEAITEEVIEKSKKLIDSNNRAEAFAAQDEKPPTEFGFRDAAHAKKVLINAGPGYERLKYYYLDRPETKTGAIVRREKNVSGLRYPSHFSGGNYKIRVRAAAYDGVPERRKYLSFSFFASKTDDRLLEHVKVNGTLDDPEVIEISVENPATVKGSFSIKERNYKERASVNYIDSQWRKENGIGTPPSLWIDWVEIEGPYFDEWPPSEVTDILQPKRKDESDEAHARRVFTRFATRAFREKAPGPELIDKLVARYLAKLERGEEAKTAMLDGLALILSSPSFLYLLEPREDDEPAPLSDRELAIRLAYFLWSAPPDEELMAAARDGKLSDPGVLGDHTDRLLDDPRSDHFVRGFTHQWLDMKRVDMFDFSAKFHPEFDEAVRESARQEIYETIRYVLDHKLPIETLLKSDFIVINDILADFYELPGVTGSEFQKVSLTQDSIRGGFLGTAATHIMGSDGQRTSPVERGAWVLRHLLNDPPPPAPPNVPMLEHEDQALPIRELQKLHQEEPQCASCHKKIDPIGYGLENFTAAGLWREVERVQLIDPDGTKESSWKAAPQFKEFPIDPSGHLPGGESFTSYQELRETIVANYCDSFARGLTENLIAFALGRPYGISDYNLATTIVKKGATENKTISAYIHALVQSEAFRLK